MEEAEARRQKLQALKERAKRAREGGDSLAEEAPKLKFRNYQPKTDEFKDGVVAPVKISADKELEKMGATQTKPEVQLDVAPKKANWDLKQHISKKLEKLERRTQQAIVDLIKAKVADDGDAESGRLLAAGVSGKAS
mmetsp:Transcript_59581/g.87328  ORF Transcript_59581/g.87328 Transcript_59581/m.87328 type:complete len:137 (+) Transcript_59581:51-461(+)|eukprot:CAMPEP_0179458322 /NCGR_PEP_ID=MMETSP0799-20121207/41900_1 /TAXON_ID=46947 /ORGANISM="Geminigera cryophila, Strain CCMP2564" /LENGTH=136 /DNA_ID=CAMNT_0021259513 /DNA_START=25 /DNA_END=435 /DNA_ORIENTATION=+